MKLKDYLHENKISQKGFGKKLGRTQQCVSNYCNGYIPKRETALKIIKLTKGAVTLADLWNM